MEPELEVLDEIPEESEDEDVEVYSLNESITTSEKLLRTLMTRDDFDSSDTLYFSSVIDRLKRSVQKKAKQMTLDRFLRF